MEDYHYDFLNEITDRNCAKMSNVSSERFAPFSVRRDEPQNIKRVQLGDDIYKNVWFEVSELQRSDKERLGSSP